MEDYKIKVYVKLNSDNCITNVNSSVFLQDTNGWIEIDEGLGDRYSHAQGNYFEKGIMDMGGRPNYKYVDNKVVELTNEEKEILYPPIPPQPSELEKTKDDLKASDSYLLKLSTLGIDEIQKMRQKITELENEIQILKGGN